MSVTTFNSPLGKSQMSTAVSDAPATATDTLSRTRAWGWRVAFCLPLVVIPPVLLFAPETPPLWQSATGLLLLIALFAATITDALWLRIPNWITYSAVLWGLLINAVAAATPEAVAIKLGAVGLTESLWGGLVPFGFMLVLFSMTGGGAGDVKLVTAIGVWLGLSLAIEALLCSFICAGGFALVRAVWVQGPWQLTGLLLRTAGSYLLPMWVFPPSEEQRKLLKSPMPLAPSFAIGTMLVVFQVVPREYFS